MATTDQCCSIVPYFKVKPGQLPAFKELCERFIRNTESEPACLYYGFAFDGDIAHCREGYADAQGCLAHLKNVAPLLQESAKFADLKPQYFTLEYGFRC